MQPMLGLPHGFLLQDEMTKTLKQGWQTLHQGKEKASEALQIFRKAIELDPKDPRAHNYCGIANEILQNESAAKKKYEEAERCCRKKHTGDDYDKSLRKLQNLRKWVPIGFRNRGDAQGKPESTGTDFLISFQTEDGDFNDKALKKLSERDVCFEEKKGQEKKGH